MPHHDTYLAGVKFRPGAVEHVAKLPDGTALTLEPEPTNRYDRNAVKVLHDGMHVGYVPRDMAFNVVSLIRLGRVTKCVLTKSGGKRISIYYEDEGHEAKG